MIPKSDATVQHADLAFYPTFELTGLVEVMLASAPVPQEASVLH
jgi:hypothetical protein